MSAHVEVQSNRFAECVKFRQSFARNCKRFGNEEQGSILILSLFLFIMMLMVAGMAVDLMRSETQRARLQSTLDRAVLAGASLEQTLDSEDVVRDYFEKAGLTEYLTDVTVVEDNNSKIVTATAESNIDTFFLNMLGVNELKSPAGGQAEESLSNIEISLVLDISGSMGWWSDAGGDSKINLLQDAAKDFVFRMQCNPDDPTGSSGCSVETDTVSISLVPYAEQVLVGEDLFQQFSVTNEHTSSSCADFDQIDFSSSDISLTDNLKRAAAIDVKTNFRTSNSNSKYASNSRRSCRLGDYREIMPFENSYATLQARIDDLSANGYTSIDMGMKWGTALLSPTFRPAVVAMTTGGLPAITSEFADRPYNFDERSMQKVIVLMTDGENTNQYVIKDPYRSGPSPIFKDPDNGNISAYRESNGQYKYASDGSWHYDPDGGYNNNAERMDYADFWREYNYDVYEERFYFLPDPYTKYGYSSKNVRLNAICTAAKAQNIEVFTIGFETSNASNAIMQSCATSDSYHFDVDGNDLDDAFTSIAREIHKLRLTL